MKSRRENVSSLAEGKKPVITAERTPFKGDPISAPAKRAPAHKQKVPSERGAMVCAREPSVRRRR